MTERHRMAIDEKTRLDLRQAFEDLIGPELADAAMEAMPNLDYDELASKAGLESVRVELRGDLADLRGELKSEMAELRGELKGEMAGLQVEMAELRRDVCGDIGGLRVELKGDMATLRTEMTANLRIMLLGQVGTAIALGGLIVRLA